MFKVNVLTLAMVALTGASIAHAGNIYIEATGYGVDQQTSVQGVPGLAETPSTALYQLPRLRNYGGDGWPASLQLVIDIDTGAVSDFTMTLTSDQVFGSGGPQSDIRFAGRNYTAGSHMASICTVAPTAKDYSGNPLSTRPAVPAGGNGDGSSGQLIWHCEGAVNGQNFAQLNDRRGFCATTQPTSTVPGENGCGAAWAGDVIGNQPIQAASTQAVCLSDAFNTAYAAFGGNMFHSMAGGSGVTTGFTVNGQGLSVNPLAPDPTLYCSTNFHENSIRRVEHEGRGGRAGGTITVNHSGSLAGGDFTVTSVDYVHDTDIAFQTQAGPAAAQSFTLYSFDTIMAQAGGATAGKNVPAMGAFGLAALLAGLITIAVRLRRRVL